MPTAGQSIIDEVEAAIGAGSDAKCLETARRVTDLFLASAAASTTNRSSCSTMCSHGSSRRSKCARSPISARGWRWPISACSLRRLPRRRLPSSATLRGMTRSGSPHRCCRNPRGSPMTIWSKSRKTKGEQHLLAISGRWWLKEIVTDALLSRRFAERQPPRGRQSRRAGIGRRVCDHRGAGANTIPSLRSKPASASICPRTCAGNC